MSKNVHHKSSLSILDYELVWLYFLLQSHAIFYCTFTCISGIINQLLNWKDYLVPDFYPMNCFENVACGFSL